MARNHFFRLHWRLFFPLIGLLWLIIGIMIFHFVNHEKQRQKDNLESRLQNVNNTVIEAYEQGADLQRTVDFIKLFTDQTTLDPLRITVYDDDGIMVADNPGAIITLYDKDGAPIPELMELWHNSGQHATVQDMALDNAEFMISSATSPDKHIHSFAALPYEGEVLTFLSIDPMVWIVVIALGIFLSVLTYFGVKAVCKNVYTLQDFARAIATDHIPEDVDSWHFSKDELGEVSRNLLNLYREKIHAEQEKIHHEHQIGMNVSHELRTPVGIVKGYLDTILDDENMPEETKHKFLVRAQQNINRLSDLINDVGMVMNLQENGKAIKCERINFHDVSLSLVEDVTHGHLADNMKFCINVPDPCYVKGHKSLLTNALLNLIYNASKHSGGSHISLNWIETENGYHKFAFSDDGIGVGEEHLSRLFDMFYRVDSGRTRKTGGSGLGLPLVKKIIEAVGGTIAVENAETGGLRFIFTLPAD